MGANPTATNERGENAAAIAKTETLRLRITQSISLVTASNAAVSKTAESPASPKLSPAPTDSASAAGSGGGSGSGSGSGSAAPKPKGKLTIALKPRPPKAGGGAPPAAQ